MFEVFARRLPTGRRYGVVAGTGRLIELIRDFRFHEAELDYLRTSTIVDDDTVRWLAGYRFRGDVSGYPEGELFFPGSPILTVTGTFAECVILETVILSVLNHDCAIAAAAARMVTAARGRHLHVLVEAGRRADHALRIRELFAQRPGAAAADRRRVAFDIRRAGRSTFGTRSRGRLRQRHICRHNRDQRCNDRSHGGPALPARKAAL